MNRTTEAVDQHGKKTDGAAAVGLVPARALPAPPVPRSTMSSPNQEDVAPARSDGLVAGLAASGRGGSSGIGSSHDATSATVTARRRTPGRWRRISRPVAATRPPSQPHPRLIVARVGSREWLEAREKGKQAMLKQAEELENMADDVPGLSEEDLAAWRAYKAKFPGYMRCIATGEVTFRPTPPPSDMQEEQLSAEYMEELFAGREICPQARHFATLALKHYNSNRTHKFEMATVLLSKCFAEVDGQTFGHVNFTAAPEGQSNSIVGKRLFFAELMLIPELQIDETAEPMRVLNVCTIDDSCYGGCHLIRRDIKNTLIKNMDYERCHACSHRIKHPKGDQFIAGHNSTRMPYYSSFPWIPAVSGSQRCHACSHRIKHSKGDQFIAGHNSTRMPYCRVSVDP